MPIQMRSIAWSSVLFLVRHLGRSLPPRAPVNHVQDAVVLTVDDVIGLDEINLNLLIELVRNTGCTDV